MKTFKKFITEDIPGYKMRIIMLGGPGSGKSFVTQSAFAGTGLKLVNSDVKFERDLRKIKDDVS